VIYLQCKAAYKAGFDADKTGDSTFAGCGKGQLGRHPFRKADKAILKLVGLSPIGAAGRPALTLRELQAKVAVCRVMEWETDELSRDERLYVRFFVREVEDYLATTGEVSP
jgi:hypothetical protein